MTTGLPNYAYRAMYDNNPDSNPYPSAGRAGSHSNSSQRSRQSAYGSTRGRYEDERYGNRRIEDGHYSSDRRNRPNDRRPRRGRSSSYDSSERSYDSRGGRSYTSQRRRDDDGRRRRSRSRRRRDSRSRSRSRDTDRRDQAVQKKQQQQQQGNNNEEKKSGLAKLEEYVTPFNVGILMGCMDLIGGSISLYMTNKRFSKKALAKGPAPGEPGASSGGGDKSGSADNKRQDNRHGSSHRSGGGGGSSRSGGGGSRVSRRSAATGRSRSSRGRRGRRNSPSSSSSSSSSGASSTSYWSRSDTRRFRHMPERLEYDSRGRVSSSRGPERRGTADAAPAAVHREGGGRR